MNTSTIHILDHVNAGLNIALVVLVIYGMRKLSKILAEIKELITKTNKGT